MTVQAEAIRKFIGKPAKDIYGRYVGYVIGISFDAIGQLSSIGVDRGHGTFEEYPNSQVLIDNETLIIIPTWKVQTENYSKESSLTTRRFQALDELLKNKEIPNYVYDELCTQYKDSMIKLEETQKFLTNKLTKKVDELESHVKHLERFLGNLKVQHKTGEMSDETFRVAGEYLVSGIEKTLQERRDVQEALKSMNGASATITPTSPTPLEDKSSGSKGDESIVVRLISSDA